MRAPFSKECFSGVCPGVFTRLFGLAGRLMVVLLACSQLSATAEAQDPLPPVLSKTAQSQMDSLASRVADQIRHSKIDPALPRIFVIDFSNVDDNQFSKLGSILADDFARSLSGFASGFQVEDRGAFRDYLKENWMGLDDLQSEAVCLTLARSLGGSGVVRGTIETEANQQVRISLRLDGLGTGWNGDAQLPLAVALLDLRKQPAISFARAPETVQVEPGILQPGVNGVSLPVCVFCPSPDYTELAREAKYRGTVELSLIVTKEGGVESVVVLKGAPFSLAEQAIAAVEKWKFKPAKMAGRSVTVRVPVDIEFQLY